MSIVRKSEIYMMVQFEATKEPLALADLLKEFETLPDTNHGIGEDYHVSKLDIQLSTAGNYSLFIALEGELKLVDNFAIGSMQFIVGYDGSVKFRFNSKLKFSNTILDIKAEKKDNIWIMICAFENRVTLGDMIQELSKEIDSISNIFKKLEVSNFTIKYNTKEKTTTFAINIKFPLDDKNELYITIELSSDADSRFKVKGVVKIDKILEFNLSLDSKYLIASYDGDASINVKKLVENFSKSASENIPDNLEITIKNILFIYNQKESLSIIGMKLNSNLDLSEINFVSEIVSDEFNLKMSDFQLLYSSSKLTADELSNLAGDTLSIPKSTEKGLNLSANFQLGEENVPISYLFGKSRQQTAKSPNREKIDTKKALVLPSNRDIKWLDLKLELGVFKISRLGFMYKDSKLYILINASIEIGVVKFTVIGLGAGSSLKEFSPKFALDGVALEIKTSSVEISGLLYRDGLSYNGSALIKTPTMAISAIASYQSEPFTSLFIYARADFPPIGPLFLSINGLTAGVGINRDLILPQIDKIAEFPLVEYAITPNPPDMEKALITLQHAKESLPPKLDKHFICFGIKFSSFQIINSFALVTLSFGKELDVNVIGMSTLIMPPKLDNIDKQIVEPIAVVQMGFMARYLPKKGELSIRAEILSGSYIFAKECILTGGFAFSSWFHGENEGDFVVTLGGYNPNFTVPKHYPIVKPVELNWRISNELKVKGSIYFALCSHAIMAGARLEASYESGDIRAWFKATIDLLLAWKPFYYEANLEIEVGGRYTVDALIAKVSISVNVGAKLDIWGPDFAGDSVIKLGPVDIKISFGESRNKNIKPIEWNEFEKTFLPANRENICKIAIEDGVIKRVKDKKITVVSPGDFTLLVDSVIPSNRITGIYNHKTNKSEFGISPMNISRNQIESRQDIEIFVNGSRVANNKFTISENRKNIPTALWGGEEKKPNTDRERANAKRFIKDALCGIRIKPTLAIEGERVTYKPSTVAFTTKESAFSWKDFDNPNFSIVESYNISKAKIKDNDKRDNIIKKLNKLGV